MALKVRLTRASELRSGPREERKRLKAIELIDIGLNLGHTAFRHDGEQVLERARLAGIVQAVVTGTSVQSSQEALSLARSYPGVLFSTAGVHPHAACEWETNTGACLRELGAQSEVVALGEMGLDFYRNFSPREVQMEVFQHQLALAEELQLPIFLHEREAHKELLALLRECREALTNVVIHCFTGGREALFSYLDLDLYVGITGWLCDERRGVHLRSLIRDIPPDRLLLETDAPYLLPRDIRPKPSNRRNEPCYLRHIAETVSQLRAESIEELAFCTTANARRFFHL